MNNERIGLNGRALVPRAAWAGATVVGAGAGTVLLWASAGLDFPWMADPLARLTAQLVPATALQALVLSRTLGPRALAWVPATLVPVQLSGWAGSVTFLVLLILLGSTMPSWQSADWLAFAVIAIGFAAGGVPVVICQWVVLRPLGRAVRWLWLAWLPGLVFGPAWFLGILSDGPCAGSLAITLGTVAVYALATAAVLPVRGWGGPE
jgi:hypothetical protein